MSLSHAILGFLSYQPMSGYDLKKVFDESIQHFWSATQSHIYKELDGLEERDLVALRAIEQEGKPDRKEFSLTAEGRAALFEWLAAPLPLERIRAGWLIQIFFAHHLSNEQIVNLLRARRAALAEKMAELEQVDGIIQQRKAGRGAERERTAAMWQATLSYGHAHYQAELNWLDGMIQRAETLPE